MSTGREGRVVNIADWRGAHPSGRYIAYTLTKAAMIAMTQSLAQALAPNVHVNAILPGLMLPLAGHGSEGINKAAREIPAGRPGSEAEIVKALLYLLEADFVTGELLYVTGRRAPCGRREQIPIAPPTRCGSNPIPTFLQPLPESDPTEATV